MWVDLRRETLNYDWAQVIFFLILRITIQHAKWNFTLALLLRSAFEQQGHCQAFGKKHKQFSGSIKKV